MQNIDVEKAISWNPWHGCKKVSPGCKNCFVYKMDKDMVEMIENKINTWKYRLNENIIIRR